MRSIQPFSAKGVTGRNGPVPVSRGHTPITQVGQHLGGDPERADPRAVVVDHARDHQFIWPERVDQRAELLHFSLQLIMHHFCTFTFSVTYAQLVDI